jgi:hypothetical protein
MNGELRRYSTIVYLEGSETNMTALKYLFFGQIFEANAQWK